MKTQIKQIFEALKLVPQDPVHHPEGDVHTHTAIVVREIIRRTRGWDPVITMAGVFHDIGKLQTTVVHEDGRVTAHEHELVSCDMFMDMAGFWLPRFTTNMIEATRWLIRNHMRIKRIDEMRPAKVARLKEQADKITRTCPVEQTEDTPYQFDAWRALLLLGEADKMTESPGTLSSWPRFHLERDASKSLDMLITSLHVNEIRETTRIRVRSEIEGEI